MEATYSIISDVVQLLSNNVSRLTLDGPTGEYRKETIKKLDREDEVDTIDRDKVMNL